MTIKPVFVISLPRSGSTLLQKILSAHSRVGSAAEPWVMLPLAAMTGEAGGPVYAEYAHGEAVRALHDLVAASGGEAHYHAAVARFVETLYAGCLAEGCDYFVDKTPRYFLIVDYLYKVFPDARVIFLFRNPLEALASMITTWWSGTLKSYHLEMDLREGPRLMAEGYARYRDRAFAVHYQDLVAQPEETVAALCGYLGLDYEPAMVAGYRGSVFRGVMGDQKGVNTYASITTDSLAKWVAILDNPLRRAYARRLLASYGPDTLRAFRLDPADVLQRLEAGPASLRGLGRDLFWQLVSWLGRPLALDAIRGQVRRSRPYKVE